MSFRLFATFGSFVGCTSDAIDVPLDGPVGQPLVFEHNQSQLSLPKPEYRVEPITRVTVNQLSHLAPYEGQLLLASGNQQLILAGIPPEDDSPWMDGILAMIQAAPGGWHRLNLTSQIQFKVSTRSGEHLFPIGMTTEIKDHYVALHYIMQHHDDKSLRARLTLDSTIDSEAFHIHLQPITLTEPLVLEARVWSGASESQLISLDGGRAGGMTPRSLGMTYFRSRSVYSLISNRPLKIVGEDHRTRFELAPQADLDLYLGQRNQQRLPYRLGQIRECLDGACLDPWPEPTQFDALTEFQQPLGHQGDGRSYPIHPMFVRDQSHKAIAVTMLQPGLEQNWQLYPQQAYTIEDLAGRRMQRAQLQGLPGGRSALRIPAVTSRSIEVSWVDEQQAGARISIFRRDSPFLFGLDESQLVDEGSSPTKLGYHEIYVAHGPVSFLLPDGPYRLQLVSRAGGVSCVKDFELSPSNRDLKPKVVCEQKFPPPLISSRRFVRTNLHEAGAAERDQDFGVMEQQLLDDELRVGVNVEEAVAAVKVWDPSESLDVYLFPLSSQAVDIWRGIKGDSDKPIKSLLEFRDHYASEAKVEFGCSISGLGVLQLRETIERLQPDLVQAFGCGDSGREAAIFAVLDEVMAKRKKPLLITPVSLAAGVKSHFPMQVPHGIVFEGSQERVAKKWQPDLVVQDFTQVLDEGRYSLATGAWLDAHRLNAHVFELVVGAEGDSVPEQVRVIQGGQVILTLPLTGLQPGQLWRQSVKLNGEGWVRFELRGQQWPSQNSLLATSNYLRI